MTDGNQVKQILPIEIKITFGADNEMVDIGSYRFTRATFHELLKYVWRGGYPRWKAEIRPESVLSLKEALSHNARGILDGCRL